jgi:hypothetical protein
VPLLDRYVYVCPEFVLKRGKGGGRVDFQVAGIRRTLQQVSTGGAYYSAVAQGVIGKFIILNFCTALPEGYSFGIDITHCPTSEYH